MARTALQLMVSAVVFASCATTDLRPGTPPASALATPDAVATAQTPQAFRPAATLGEVAARAAHTATTLPGGDIFVAGGCVSDGCSRASADTFVVTAIGANVINGPSMAGPRDGQTATLVGHDVILIGGYAGEGQAPLATIEVFDSATGEIESAATLSLGRGGHAAAALGDGSVLVVAGWVRPRTPSASAVIFDPVTNSVRDAADLPIATDGLDAVSLADGRTLVTGGLVESGLGTDQAFVFDPQSGAWESVGPMLSPRFKHTSVLLEDGRVLVIGGTTDDHELLATTELFDPATQTFSTGPELHEPRYKMTGGALIVDGQRVLIGGGGRTVELLDLAAGTSRVLDTFAGRGSFATLSALGQGSWLMLGGYDDQIMLRRAFALIDLTDLEAAGG